MILFARLKTWRVIVALALLGIAIWYLMPIALNLLARQLIREDPVDRADVIVALGGDKRCNREKHAAMLFRDGWAKNIVVSGVQYRPGLHTGEAAKRFVVSQGVPASAVQIIRDTWNTRTEAARLHELMQQHGWKRAIIVTAAFHSRRALLTVERAAPEYIFTSAPVPPVKPEWEPDRWWARRTDMWITIREFLSWTNTLIGGLQ